MKICVFSTSFPRTRVDERTPFIWGAAKGLKSHGHEVRIITAHLPGTKPFEIWDGVEIYRTRYMIEKFEILQKEGGGIPVFWQKYPYARFLLGVFSLFHLRNLLLMSQGCDVIHANWTLPGMLAWIGKPVHQLPYLVTVHGSDIFQGGRNKWIRKLTQISLEKAHKVIAVSNSLSQEVVRIGIQSDHITVIPDGVDTDLFHPGSYDDNQYLLYAGAFIRRKGVEYLIQAFKTVHSKFHQLHLVLVGNGPLREELESLVSTLDLTGDVLFTGWQTQEQLATWMRKARLFILPSLEEGLGVVLLEALSSGVPCIASQVGGIPDIISPDIGELVPPSDSTILADVIMQYLHTPEKINEKGFQGRQIALKKYDWKVIASRLIVEFEAATKGRNT
jgi:glycosyltransferase involved in cell wall biosynthesis